MWTTHYVEPAVATQSGGMALPTPRQGRVGAFRAERCS